MFWKKKEVNSTEYETILKKISDTRHEIELVKGQLAALQTNYDNLRGQFNRKLKGLAKEEEEGTKTEYLNTGIPFQMG